MTTTHTTTRTHTEPKTFIVGYTQTDLAGLRALAEHIGFEAEDFEPEFNIISLYAKLCYRSLALGANRNIKTIRSPEENIKGCIENTHGAVFEHATINFVTTGCSRVFTHELVRHRAGMAYSQTSGRYCTPEDAELVLPPDMPETIQTLFRNQLDVNKNVIGQARRAMGVDDMPMAERKRWTSALRRLLPSGCDNEIGWTANVRALRHLIELRTSRHAEWEIRKVFNDVAEQVAARWPLLLHGGSVVMVDGLGEWTGLHV